ncbi:MAG TPA: hypothetical protein VM884_01430, partial [Flavisolibacter sp.]|nr:hypothetical protein [Flavisolibacter sp.]
HLYPSSARSGFLAHQVDLAWYYIKGMSLLGAISSYHDSKAHFLKQYHLPYKQKTASPAKTATLLVNKKYTEQQTNTKL